VLERESACSEGIRFDEISIVFLGDRATQRLNRMFTGRDAPTDTLAFELTPEMRKRRPVPGIRLGEVIVCVDRAILQSKRYRVSLEKEVARLLIHGLLHLCGLDDGTSNGRAMMHKRENLHIASLDRPISSLITPRRKDSASRNSKVIASRRGTPTSRGSKTGPSRRKTSTSRKSNLIASRRRNSSSRSLKGRGA